MGERGPEPGNGNSLDYAVGVDAHSAITGIGLDVYEPAPNKPPEGIYA